MKIINLKKNENDDDDDDDDDDDYENYDEYDDENSIDQEKKEGNQTDQKKQQEIEIEIEREKNKEEKEESGNDHDNINIEDDLIDQTLNNKIFLCYNSKACNEKMCFDQSPNYPFNRHAILHGMFRSINGDITDIIHCIGGIKVFLPLLLQLDYEEFNNNSNNNELLTKGKAKAKGKKIHTNIDLTNKVFEILVNILMSNPLNQEDMLLSEGFKILSNIFIKKLNPQNLDNKIILIFKQLILNVKNKQLINSFIKDFLLNFEIWVYCDYKIQISLINLLIFIIKLNKYNHCFNFQELVDNLKIYYWIKPNLQSRTNLPKRHSLETNIIVGKRPTKEQLLEIRLNYLEFLQEILFIKKRKKHLLPYLIKLIEYCIFLKNKFEAQDALIKAYQICKSKKFLILNINKASDLILFKDKLTLLIDTKNEICRSIPLKIINLLFLQKIQSKF